MSTLIWIDDHISGVTLRKPILESCGYFVLTARTAHEGLALLSSKPVDAVILDCNLPDMDSELLVRQIRAMDSTLPVVVLSPQYAGVPEGLAGCANAVFSKARDPFSSVVTRVAELVTERKQRSNILES